VKITRLSWILGLGIVMTIALSACSSGAPTALPTRVATQTPWIIERVITATPEPPIATTIPPSGNVPVKTPTKAPTAKPAVVPTVKPPVAPPVAAASPTTAPPACSVGAVTLLFPENGAPRNTRKDGSGGSAFIMKWTPFQNGDSDPSMGYRIEMESKRGGKTINGATVYVAHNKYLRDGQQFVFDARAVSLLAAGENASVTWKVIVVKSTGSFNDTDYNVTPPGVVACSAASIPFTIQLIVPD